MKRIPKWRAISVRKIVGQRGRWEGDVSADVGKLNVWNCRKLAVDREAWKKVAKQAKVHRDWQRQEKNT